VFFDPLGHRNIVFLRSGEVPCAKVGSPFAAVQTEEARDVTEVGSQGGSICVGFVSHGMIHSCNAKSGNGNIVMIFEVLVLKGENFAEHFWVVVFEQDWNVLEKVILAE
jgi:hypothetical protein